MGLALLLTLVLGGCDLFSGSDNSTAESTASEQAAPASDGATANAQTTGDTIAGSAGADEGERPVIVALGDSITAGYGLAQEQAWPALLQERLDARGYPHRVVNAGVSGDTTAGGLARLDWVFRQGVDVLIVALGGNDALRGLETGQMRDNLRQIVERAQARGARVLLAGMHAPRNLGEDYTTRFHQVFVDLAERYDVVFLSFLLEGVAMDPQRNQPDGIHPNAEGQRVVMENVWEELEPMLREGGG